MEQGSKRRRLRAPSPAMLVACIALFVALGGTSYAAIVLPANSVGTKQIKNNAVTAAKVKNNAVTNAKVKNATLTGAKIADGTLTGAKIADGALTGAKIADGALDPAKFGTIPGARVRHALTAVTVDDNSTTTLSYDTTDFNIGGVFDGAHPTRMTAPVAGRYLIIASVRWDSNWIGRRTLALGLTPTVGTVAEIARTSVSAYWITSASFAPEQMVETIYKLNAGDYVEVWANQDSGGSLNLMVAADNGVTFSMQWIAP